ncbi:MAG TPA: HipA domain-containing protein [Solirubrobacterales bacterium]|jgi:serine/threonine-protein kinase HipA|nr:HipA domain-containing protein [Solirubrobacterales bacterium]
MARKARRLGVWLDRRKIAELEQRRWPEIRCRYTEVALEAWALNSPVLSCSLPLGETPLDALAFCRGLLPEGQALQALAARANLAVNDTFELLSRYGRDIAGALVISAEEPLERRLDVEAYTPARLAAALEELEEFPLGVHDDSELSLAGLQDKLLLVDLGKGMWGRPLHGRPSTHILKADDPRHAGLIRAEGLCLELARAAGLSAVEQRLEVIGDSEYLILSRFDRATCDGAVRRIHQEDLCQATGIDPDGNRGRAKYERGGGPSLRDLAGLLDTYALDPQAQLDRLVAAITFTVLIGNADAHGKNLALLHPTPQTVELAPLYDTVPTALWPKLHADAAMAIGGQPSLPAITASDIVREARSWPHLADRARAVVGRTAIAMRDAVEAEAIPPKSNVAEYVDERARQLLGGL